MTRTLVGLHLVHLTCTILYAALCNFTIEFGSTAMANLFHWPAWTTVTDYLLAFFYYFIFALLIGPPHHTSSKVIRPGYVYMYT